MRSVATASTPLSSFSHVFSAMAVQVLPHLSIALDGALYSLHRLLRPFAVAATALWDFDEPCGPQAVWDAAARAVDPSYMSSCLVSQHSWTGGLRKLEAGLKEVRFEDIRAAVCRVGL